MRCPRCGSEAPEGSRFCPACGADLGGPGPHEERKSVSVLFVDMVGSTARADGADPEDVRELNRLYHGTLRACIERFGGVVEKFIGDAVMAVFGVPLAHDDDAERAVRAALGTLEAIEELNVTRPELRLQVRAGVCTGEAVVTLDAVPGEPLATGDVVNTAARLESSAPPGGVIVGEETYRLTKDVFAFEEIDPVQAKGKREPLPAWLVGRAVAEPASRPPSATPMVGRRAELRALHEAWERVVATEEPCLITVLGPPGIGKTRFVREATDELERSGARVLWGRSLPYAEQTPYRAISEIIGRAAGIFENDPATESRMKLTDLLAGLSLGEEEADAARHLSLLMGLGLDDPTDDPVHFHYASRRLIEELAGRTPLVVVFEDAYWADDPLLDLIEYLVTQVRARPVMFVALARPELLQRRSAWGQDVSAHATFSLEPLTADEATELASRLIAPQRRTATDRVVQTAEGNPLFLEELAAVVDGDPDVLPPTVRAATVARIDALPPGARTTLLHASVMGQTFWRGVVAASLEIDDVDVALDALMATGLVRREPRSRVTGDVEYAIKHVLVRDAAYEMLPRATRRTMHAAVAAEIERRAADPNEVAWILAYHCREAGETDRAVRFYLLAAERARDAMATEETWDLYTQALDLVGSEERRRAIRLERGVALVDLWESDRGVAELTALLPELRGAQEGDALIACARAMAGTEHTDEMFAWARRAVELAAEAPEVEGRALAVLGKAHSMRGGPGDLAQAVELGDRAFAGWPTEGRPYELSEHYHMQIAVNYWMGSYERGLELAREGSQIGGLGPQSAEYVIGSFGQIGLNLAGLGRYEEAIARGDEAIATAHRLGAWDIRVTNDSTGPLRDVYAYDEARRRSEAMVERLGPSDFNMPWMNARADLIAAQLLADDLGAVERDWPAAWDDAVASPAWEHWLITGRLAIARAELALRLGRLDESVLWSERALDLARPVGRRKYEIVSLITLGRALTRQRLDEQAASPLHEAVSLADRLGSPLYRWQARAALAETARRVPVEDASADDHLEEAVRIIYEIAGSLSSERAAGYLAAREVAEALELVG